MNGDPRGVLISPVVSEKSYGQMADRRKYTFRVHQSAHKTQVRQAVEEIFEVSVTRVNIASAATFGAEAKNAVTGVGAPS